LIAFAVLALAPALYLIAASRDLRPIADDYCNAARVTVHGVVGATWNLFTTWHGGIVGDFLVSLLAWPLTASPWVIAYVPFFFLTVSLVMLGNASVLAWGWVGIFSRLRVTLALGPIALLAFVISFWGTGVDDRERFLTYATLGWQAASLLHLMPVLLSMLLFSLLVQTPSWPAPRRRAVALIGGILVANLNMSESLGTFSLFTAAGLLVVPMLGSAYRPARESLLLAAGGAVASGLLIYVAPGTQERAEFFPDRGPLETFRNALGTVASGFRDAWGGVIGSPGLYLTLLMFMATGLLLGRRVASEKPSAMPVIERKLVLLTLTFAVYSLFGLLAALAAESASYVSEWHSISPLAAMVLSAATGGSVLGLRMGKARPQAAWQVPIAVVIMIGAFGLGVRDVHGVVRLVEERQASWSRGPAPLGTLIDRQAWAKSCWRDLARGREPTTGAVTRGIGRVFSSAESRVSEQ
jgi:hypothetical protein